MAPVIEFADWIAMQESIKAGAQAVSGMTAAEAQAALNASATATQSGQLYVYGSQAAQAVKPPLQFPASSAAQAAGNYVSSGGLTTATGAATSSASTAQISNMALTQTAGGATGVAGLLSMNLPTAAAAIAPLAGVALGVGLYSLAPDFWEKISRALLPFCYDGTELLPVVVDEKGSTFFPKSAIDSVKEVLTSSASGSVITSENNPGIEAWNLPLEYEIGTDSLLVISYEINGVPTERYYYLVTDRPVKVVCSSQVSSSGDFYVGVEALSDSPFRYASIGNLDWENEIPALIPKEDVEPVEINGKIVYSTGIAGAGFKPGYTITLHSRPLNTTKKYALHSGNAYQYAIVYDGTQVLPDGTSEWKGPEYPSNPETLDVVTSIDGSNIVTETYYPISIPVGTPGVSVDPATSDITVNPNPAPAINPWISPNPNPGTYPEKVPVSDPAKLPAEVPDYSPNLDPNADPSQEPQPLPDLDPAETQKEKDEGESPNPSIPIIPTPSAAAGLLHVYNPTKAQVDEFGSWLWTTFSGDLIDTLSKLFNDPMDAVIGLHELYVTPSVTGTATIRAGYLDSGISSNLVGNRYTSINCGSIVVPEFYGNYLDYSPYTKCFIYLPFVGIVPVTADDIVGNAVNVTYNIDAYNGCCIAIVTVAREGYSSTVYQFEGNCGVEIPITSGYQSVLMGGLLGIAGTAISGSPHVGLGLASLGRANLGKNEVSRSGSFGSSYGAMGAKIPYIIVKRPTQKSVVNYNQEYGFPAHKRVLIGACEGYLRVREVHVISPTATDAEKALIETMLKEGVFVK